MSLFLSIVSMLLGPVVYSAANYVKNLREILDGYIFITIICLVCFHIIPEAYEIGGNLIIPFMLIGLLLPVTMEFFFQRALKKTHVVTLMIAMLGLAIHADRKTTRLNSSHDQISYPVFCLKKKTKYDSANTSQE